jgi:predicted Rossmann fold flavoprotein
MKKVAVIGGGPAGMMSAVTSAKAGNKVTIFERNNKLGKKLLLTGGSRCNITNLKNIKLIISDDIIGNGKFLYKALSFFGPDQIINFLAENDCPIRVEDNNRVFPQVQRSSEIIRVFESAINKLGVEKIYNSKIVDFIIKDNHIIVEGQKFDHIIIATGGKTYPNTGSDGSMYQTLSRKGIQITKLIPIESGIIFNKVNSELQGIALNNTTLKVVSNGKVIYQNNYDILFTHFGLSGPGALRSSYYFSLNKFNNVHLEIDFLPDIKADDLRKLIEKMRNDKSNRIDEILNENHPKRIVKALFNDLAKIDLNNATKIQINKIIERIKNHKEEVVAVRKFETAFVTSGGVDLKQVDPSTLKLKKHPNISIVGELLDVQGHTGGNNLTICLATGALAGEKV